MSVDVPTNQWRDPNGLIEFGSESADDIVDTAGINLVDTTGEDIVDTGVTAQLIPSTIWEEIDNV